MGTKKRLHSYHLKLSWPIFLLILLACSLSSSYLCSVFKTKRKEMAVNFTVLLLGALIIRLRFAVGSAVGV